MKRLSVWMAFALVGCSDPGNPDPFAGGFLRSLARVDRIASDPAIVALTDLGPYLPDALAHLGSTAPGALFPSAASGRRFIYDPDSARYLPGGSAAAGSLDFVIYETVPATTRPALPLRELGTLSLRDDFPEAVIELTSQEGSGRWTVSLAPPNEATGHLQRPDERIELTMQRRVTSDSIILDLAIAHGFPELAITRRTGLTGVSEEAMVDLRMRAEGDLRLTGRYDVRGPHLIAQVNGRDFARIFRTSVLALVIERLDGVPLTESERALLSQAESLNSTFDGLLAAVYGPLGLQGRFTGAPPRPPREPVRPTPGTSAPTGAVRPPR